MATNEIPDEAYDVTTAYIASRLSDECAKADASFAVVLGSGLAAFTKTFDVCASIPYARIPHFPDTTVDGHEGTLFYARRRETGAFFWVMSGRIHFYEGYSLAKVTFPIRVLASLGVKRILLTNAAGGVNEAYAPASFMAITDHVNLMGSNPLVGANTARFGVRFPDMGAIYASSLRKEMARIAEAEGVTLHQGVYAAVSGPSYETPAEVRMLRALGVDAVGMSTVPEAIVARHAGIEVAGVSLITNVAAGMSDAPLSHADVTKVAHETEDALCRFLAGTTKAFLAS